MDEFELIRQMADEDRPAGPEARARARAALVARFEDDGGVVRTRARWRSGWVPRLAFVGVLGAVVAVLLVVLGAGDPRGEFAEGAELKHLADLAPHLQIAGGWQITQTSIGREGGATRFHYEGPLRHESRTAEIRWSTASVEQLRRQLERRGLKPAGTMPTKTTDVRALRAGDFPHTNKHDRALAYASPRHGKRFFRVVGLWSQGPWSFELSARVGRLDLLERFLERIEILRREEWLVAIRPGGAKWLVDSFYGTAQRLENVKTELPNGNIVYETRTIEKASGSPEARTFTSPLPVIRRDGNRITVSFERPPTASPPH